jgi:hypothetical protein
MIRWSRRAEKSAFKRSKESFEEWKKFGQRFVLEQTFARKTLFPWEYCNDWDSNQVLRLVPTVLHLSAAKSEEFCFGIFKKMTKVWTCRREPRSSTQKKKNTIKHFDSPKIYVVLNPRYCYWSWAFSPCFIPSTYSFWNINKLAFFKWCYFRHRSSCWPPCL